MCDAMPPCLDALWSAGVTTGLYVHASQSEKKDGNTHVGLRPPSRKNRAELEKLDAEG